MKSLYVRITVTFVLIAFFSSLLGLLVTSLYYEQVLKSDNERKIEAISGRIKQLYEQYPEMDLERDYLPAVAEMGYQLHLVTEEGRAVSYGSPFKHGSLSEEEIRSVLEGRTYNGMGAENRRLELIAYFENSVRNTIGVPLETPEGRAALFVRPDLQQQIGEVRIIVAVLIASTFLLSLLLIAFFTRLIVKPVKKLTMATKKIVQGDYRVGLETSRKDEIGDLANHFSRMTDSIRRLDEMRQEFVANVSHEIQTPLTSIQGYVRAIREESPSATEANRYLDVIESESRRLSSLSQQLLTLASLDKGDKALRRSAFRLDEQLRQVLISLEWQWASRSLELEPDLEEVVVEGDPELLYEVWLNLISNAMKFSEDGGKLGVLLRREGRSVRVTVWDQGCGIPEEDLPFIFERFHKADKARGSRRSGSGLGLSIARQIVNLHDGEIEARSALGEGTSITVILPA
ncbi:cell wall metabolism sensor histidine kinase WalK [Cohnella sp. AR92]|uniref:sensor histidine kinase n=1 Tax=Cohnella sp. AR92 TaxID=648716 RepID=UPI000F8E9AA6|nr:HAMP domain-containing sensor histidine kinase [Cohnella sp. AR92]RUS47299.1 HAMP domain-containing histidine kinase [Cohnella sp. AR92]